MSTSYVTGGNVTNKSTPTTPVSQPLAASTPMRTTARLIPTMILLGLATLTPPVIYTIIRLQEPVSRLTKTAYIGYNSAPIIPQTFLCLLASTLFATLAAMALLSYHEAGYGVLRTIAVNTLLGFIVSFLLTALTFIPMMSHLITDPNWDTFLSRNHLTSLTIPDQPGKFVVLDEEENKVTLDYTEQVTTYTVTVLNVEK